MRFAHLKRILKLGRLRLRGHEAPGMSLSGRHRTEAKAARNLGRAASTSTGFVHRVGLE
jgi:hypothetical protein